MKNPCLVTFFTFPLFLWELDTFKVRIAMALNDLRRFFGRGKALKDLVALIGWYECRLEIHGVSKIHLQLTDFHGFSGHFLPF